MESTILNQQKADSQIENDVKLASYILKKDLDMSKPKVQEQIKSTIKALNKAVSHLTNEKQLTLTKMKEAKDDA